MQASTSYALRPSPCHRSTFASIQDTAHELGVHDALRHGGPRALAAEANAIHPLEPAVKSHEQVQQDLKFTLHRNLYGLHAPIRQLMEQEMVSESPLFSGLGRPSNIHLDILRGKDEILTPEDVLGIEEKSMMGTGDFHLEAEKQRRI